MKYLNKPSSFILFLVIILISSEISIAIDLESPLKQKKITAKTELIRGYSLVCETTKKSSALDTNSYLKSISDIIIINRQNNTDSEPFLLGVYFSAWFFLNIRINAINDSVKKYGSVPHELKYQINLNKLMDETINYYFLFRKLQKNWTSMITIL